MKKLSVILTAVFVAFVYVCGCAKSSQNSPSSPSTAPTSIPTATATVSGLYVEQADITQAQSSHGVGTGTANFVLRYGNAAGAFVRNATITIGTGTLVESLPGHYSKIFNNTADGASINVSISSLAGNASSLVVAPYDGEITTPSADGNNQSAASTMEIDWRYYIISGTIPQKVQILLWRSSDNLIVFNQTYTPIANGEYITIPANMLPSMGQVYIRAYSINQAAIVGANGGSAMFRMFNSENTHYVNMIN
jgi:hypothetical protein